MVWVATGCQIKSRETSTSRGESDERSMDWQMIQGGWGSPQEGPPKGPVWEKLGRQRSTPTIGLWDPYFSGWIQSISRRGSSSIHRKDMEVSCEAWSRNARLVQLVLDQTNTKQWSPNPNPNPNPKIETNCLSQRPSNRSCSKYAEWKCFIMTRRLTVTVVKILWYP